MAIQAGETTFYQAKRGIVQDGLVLNLDAAVDASYSGGTTWRDLEGGNNGTFINMDGTNFSSENGGKLYFNGANEYVQGSNIGISGSPDFSISYWAYWAGSSWSSNFPSGFGNSTFNTGAGLSTTWRDGRIALDYWNNRFRATSALSVQTWYYVAFVKTAGINSAANTSLYVNGGLVSGAVENGTSVNITNSNYVIGRLDGTRWFNGYVNLITLYNRTLTANEVAQNFNATRHRFGV